MCPGEFLGTFFLTSFTMNKGYISILFSQCALFSYRGLLLPYHSFLKKVTKYVTHLLPSRPMLCKISSGGVTLKKLVSILGISALIMLVTACGGGDKEKASDVVPVADIMHAIKEQIAEDMKADFGDEDVLVDGQLQGYIEADLTDKDSEDPMIEMLHEKMELNEEELDEGIVLMPMMNVNSNEIIVLKAKEKAYVESLKETLGKELAAQTMTWEMYLPDQYEKVKNNLILTEGKHLIYITYEDPSAIEKIFNEKVK